MICWVCWWQLWLAICHCKRWHCLQTWNIDVFKKSNWNQKKNHWIDMSLLLTIVVQQTIILAIDLPLFTYIYDLPFAFYSTSICISALVISHQNPMQEVYQSQLDVSNRQRFLISEVIKCQSPYLHFYTIFLSLQLNIPSKCNL